MEGPIHVPTIQCSFDDPARLDRAAHRMWREQRNGYAETRCPNRRKRTRSQEAARQTRPGEKEASESRRRLVSPTTEIKKRPRSMERGRFFV